MTKLIDSKSGRGGYPNLDILKIALAYIIMARHLAQSFAVAGSFTFTLIVNTISTVGVPTFFVVSGFLLYKNGDCDQARIISQIKRILIMYLVWSIIYLPLNIRSILQSDNIVSSVLEYFQNAIFSGTYYHLWYLPALAVGIGIVYLLKKVVRGKKALLITFSLLFLIGLFGGSWNCWNPEIVKNIFKLYREFFVTTRNGIFFAPVFIYMGELIAEHMEAFSIKPAIICLIVGCIFLAFESYFLYCSEPTQVNNMMLSPLLISPALVICCIRKRNKKGYPMLRKASTLIFCVHPWVITVSLFLLKSFNDAIKTCFIIIVVTLISFLIPAFAEKLKILKLLY